MPAAGDRRQPDASLATMTASILFACPFTPGLDTKLAAHAPVIGPSPGPAGASLEPEARKAVRVLVTMGTLVTDGAVMDALPGLGLIACYGTGYEGVDLAAAARRGIMVTHSPEANAAAVADLAMALLLACGRKIVLADRFVREGRWTADRNSRMPVAGGLTGRRLGVFGFGAIGRRIAARAAAFEMEVAYHNRSRKDDVSYPFHATLQGLADWADILMIAARADASNRHVVNRAVLAALGPEGIVVNIARGSIMDEAALAELLETGELGGAGLDVFEHEPAVPEALKQSQRTVLAPHIGGGTRDAQEAMQLLVARNIAAFLAGRPVLTPVPEMKG